MSSIVFQILAFLLFVLLLWYFIGSYLNRKQSKQIIQWIQKGLHTLGEKMSVHQLRRFGFQVLMEQPRLPFKEVSLVVILEPRSRLLFWILHRLKGQKSLLSVKGDFQAEPRLEFEIFDPQSRTGKEALWATTREKWISREMEDTSVVVASQSADSLERLAEFYPTLQPWLSQLLRISVRKKSPHLLANFSLPGLEMRKAEELFIFLKELGGFVLPQEAGSNGQ